MLRRSWVSSPLSVRWRTDFRFFASKKDRTVCVCQKRRLLTGYKKFCPFLRYRVPALRQTVPFLIGCGVVTACGGQGTNGAAATTLITGAAVGIAAGTATVCVITAGDKKRKRQGEDQKANEKFFQHLHKFLLSVNRWYSYQSNPGSKQWGFPCRRSRMSDRKENRSGRSSVWVSYPRRSSYLPGCRPFPGSFP